MRKGLLTVAVLTLGLTACAPNYRPFGLPIGISFVRTAAPPVWTAPVVNARDYDPTPPKPVLEPPPKPITKAEIAQALARHRRMLEHSARQSGPSWQDQVTQSWTEQDTVPYCGQTTSSYGGFASCMDNLNR